ncbi:arsenate reductase family protein [Litchfieldella xinjiangensis]|uniref:arsenate reductase family protein n=1 Tax=Litchfieldella xinjiangensis TaxID=1166948 RepID=UPI0005BC7D35|nr:arsenate reductase family protein [Halomonas xinjiangensis]
MPSLILYHNPRCSKSRQALALLEERGVSFQTLRYLEAPLDRAALGELAERLDGGLAAMVRDNETEWKALNLDIADPQAVLEAIANHPKLMQRPILDTGQRAIVGRPPEAVLSLIEP